MDKLDMILRELDDMKQDMREHRDDSRVHKAEIQKQFIMTDKKLEQLYAWRWKVMGVSVGTTMVISVIGALVTALSLLLPLIKQLK